ncbi:hypothetical protein FI667_g2555, partial [Globisporangium splendens]
MQRGGEITCVFGLGSRVFVGDAQGFLCCYDALDGGEAVAVANGAAGVQEARLAGVPRWETRAAQEPILSLCVVPDGRASHERATAAENLPLLVAAGVASGELVLFRNETEVRRLQLESAVLQLSARHGDEAQFVAADLLGSLYGVNQYEVLWKRHLAVTHEGNVCAWIRTRAPITTIASFSPEFSGRTPAEEDVILAAGEEGIIYRVTTSRDSASKFQFVLDVWTEVAFPIARILPVGMSSRTGDAFQWACLGMNGQVALLSGKECVREWNSASSSFQKAETNHLPLDMALITSEDNKDAHQHVLAVAYPDTLRFFPLTTLPTDSL